MEVYEKGRIMSETKDRQIMVNIEATFYNILCAILSKENKSASAYARSLIIKDLMAKGLLTESILAHVVTGERE